MPGIEPGARVSLNTRMLPLHHIGLGSLMVISDPFDGIVDFARMTQPGFLPGPNSRSLLGYAQNRNTATPLRWLCFKTYLRGPGTYLRPPSPVGLPDLPFCAEGYAPNRAPAGTNQSVCYPEQTPSPAASRGLDPLGGSYL